MQGRVCVCGLRFRIAWIVYGDSGQNNRLAVGKFSDKRQVAAHRLDRLAERRKQQVAALFKFRNTVLTNSESLGHAHLRELESERRARPLSCDEQGLAASCSVRGSSWCYFPSPLQ